MSYPGSPVKGQGPGEEKKEMRPQSYPKLTLGRKSAPLGMISTIYFY